MNECPSECPIYANRKKSSYPLSGSKHAKKSSASTVVLLAKLNYKQTQHVDDFHVPRALAKCGSENDTLFLSLRLANQILSKYLAHPPNCYLRYKT